MSLNNPPVDQVRLLDQVCGGLSAMRTLAASEEAASLRDGVTARQFRQA
jgi:hypothetical protein